MNTEQLYIEEALVLDFTAEVVESFAMDTGQYRVVLPGTYFYPTGGGQEHDTGFIGEARVLDVYKEDDRIVHVLDRELSPGEYPARIDRERRFRHMQHHTGQHILSASFLEVLEIESVSASINGNRPSTIDLEAEALSQSDLMRVEAFANGILFEDREVKSYFITDAEVSRVPFRKSPQVAGRIRVVEVEGCDFTPCGGTHCPRTGMVGVIKIVRTERVNQKLRVHFVAGWQALDFFESIQEAAQGAALRLDCGLEGVVESIDRLQDQLKESQHDVEALRNLALKSEAEELCETAEPVGRLRLVRANFDNRNPADLRTLGDELRRQAGTVALLASFDGMKLSLVAACAEDTGLDARDLLMQHLKPLGGRGGGAVGLAQGGGSADAKAARNLFADTRKFLE